MEMATLESVLAPGSVNLPDCVCGMEMKEHEPEDPAIRIFQCPSCGRELRITVWAEQPTR